MRKNKAPTGKLHCIAYCGLYCPRCYKIKIATSSGQLLTELESAQDKGAKFLQESPELKSTLVKLIALKCKKFCREDRKKSANCAIKLCCDEHKIIGCWKCPDLDSCKKLRSQFLANNKKLKKLDIDKYIEQYK